MKSIAFSVFIKETESLNAEGYAKLAIDCLNDPKLSKIKKKISAFVGDGLRSQVAGLTPGKPTSFQSSIEDPDLRKIFFSPCYNHRLQNAIKKTFTENMVFKKYVNSIHDFSIFLRKPEIIQKLGAICPEPIETRWNYLFDICSFIKKYKDPILALMIDTKLINISSDDEFPEEESIPDDEKPNYELILTTIDKILTILWPFKAATLCLSYDNCSLANVYPIFSDLILKYETIRNELSPMDTFVSVINNLINNIKSYTFDSAEFPIFYLAYMLTPMGRSLLYLEEKGFPAENEDDDIHFQPYVLPDLDTVFNKSEIKKVEPTENIEAIQDIHLTNLDQSNSDETEHNENSRDESDPNDTRRDPGKGTDDNQNSPTRYEICKKALDILIQYLHIPSESKTRNSHTNLYNILDKWIDAPHAEIPLCELVTNENPMEIWIRIKESSQYKMWHQLAEIAMRLYGISATETICERTISLQGHISKDRSQRAKGELCDARLIHMQQKDAF